MSDLNSKNILHGGAMLMLLFDLLFTTMIPLTWSGRRSGAVGHLFVAAMRQDLWDPSSYSPDSQPDELQKSLPSEDDEFALLYQDRQEEEDDMMEDAVLQMQRGKEKQYPAQQPEEGDSSASFYNLASTMGTLPWLEYLGADSNSNDFQRLAQSSKYMRKMVFPVNQVYRYCMTPLSSTIAREEMTGGKYFASLEKEQTSKTNGRFYPKLEVQRAYTEACYKAMKSLVFSHRSEAEAHSAGKDNIGYMRPKELHVPDFRYLQPEAKGESINPLGITHLEVDFRRLMEKKEGDEQEALLTKLLVQATMRKTRNGQELKTSVRNQESYVSGSSGSNSRDAAFLQSRHRPPTLLQGLTLANTLPATSSHSSASNNQNTVMVAIAGRLVRALIPNDPSSSSSLHELTLSHFYITEELAETIAMLLKTSSITTLRIIDCRLSSLRAYKLFWHQGVLQMQALETLEVEGILVDSNGSEEAEETQNWTASTDYPPKLKSLMLKAFILNEQTTQKDFAALLAVSSIATLRIKKCLFSRFAHVTSFFADGISRMKALESLTIEEVSTLWLSDEDVDDDHEKRESSFSAFSSSSGSSLSANLKDLTLAHLHIFSALAQHISGLLHMSQNSIRTVSLRHCEASSAAVYRQIFQTMTEFQSLESLTIEKVSFASELPAPYHPQFAQSFSARLREDIQRDSPEGNGFISLLGEAISANMRTLTHLSVSELLHSRHAIASYPPYYSPLTSVAPATIDRFCSSFVGGGVDEVGRGKRLQVLRITKCPFCNNRCAAAITQTLRRGREAGLPSLRALDISHWALSRPEAFADLLHFFIPPFPTSRVPPSMLTELAAQATITNAKMVRTLASKLPQTQIKVLDLSYPLVEVPEEITAELFRAARIARVSTLRVWGETEIRADPDEKWMLLDEETAESRDFTRLFRYGFYLGQESVNELHRWLSVSKEAAYKALTGKEVEGLTALSLSLERVSSSLSSTDQLSVLLQLAEIIIADSSSSSLLDLSLSFSSQQILQQLTHVLEAKISELKQKNPTQTFFGGLRRFYLAETKWSSATLPWDVAMHLANTLQHLRTLRSVSFDFGVDILLPAREFSDFDYAEIEEKWGVDSTALTKAMSQLWRPLSTFLDEFVYVDPSFSHQWKRIAV